MGQMPKPRFRGQTPKTLVAALAAGLLLGAADCRPRDPDSDVRAVVAEYESLVRTFSDAVDRAKDARATAAALNALTDGMRTAALRVRDLAKTHPELANAGPIPDNIRPLLARLDETHAHLLTAMGKAMRFGHDAAVRAAKSRFEDIPKWLE